METNRNNKQRTETMNKRIIYIYYTDSNSVPVILNDGTKEYVNKQIQEATFFDLSPLELPTVTVEALTTTSPTIAKGEMHYIVAGAFRVKANADRKIKQLKASGFNAAYYGTNAYGLHMVTYESHTNSSDALKALRKIKQTQSPDAWLLSKK